MTPGKLLEGGFTTDDGTEVSLRTLKFEDVLSFQLGSALVTLDRDELRAIGRMVIRAEERFDILEKAKRYA